jgi:hypothetical protein
MWTIDAQGRGTQLKVWQWGVAGSASEVVWS